MLRTILEIYFAINIFIVGYYLGDDFRWSSDSRFKDFILAIILLCFGLFTYIPILVVIFYQNLKLRK